MKKFWGEFKKFISRGNVFDMAVGLIIATAFNKIVSSMVNDIIMPLVTYATGANSLQALSVPLKYAADGTVSLSWAYGNFLQTVIDFFIIALSVFVMVKVVNNSRKLMDELGERTKKELSKERKLERKEIKLLAKSQGRKFKDVWKEHEEKTAKELEEKKKCEEEKAKLEAELKAKENPSTETLLKEIRDLLKEQNNK